MSQTWPWPGVAAECPWSAAWGLVGLLCTEWETKPRAPGRVGGQIRVCVQTQDPQRQYTQCAPESCLP